MSQRRVAGAAVALASTLSILAGAGTPSAQQAPRAQTPGPAAGTISALVGQVHSLFPKVTAEVLEVQGRTVTLSVGRREGLIAGLEMALVREGRELKHPKTGEVLGRTEKEVGRVRVEDVKESYATAALTQGEVEPGDVARISAGKVRLTVVPLSSGVRDSLVEAAMTEIVEGLNRTGRFQVAMGDHVGVWAGQQSIKPEELLDGKGLKEAAQRFKIEHLLVLHFKTEQRKPYLDARFFSLPDAAPLLASALFVPPSVRAVPGQRFSGGGDRQPPQPRMRSLLARILGGELEAGSYSTGEGSIPLKEIGRFAFPIVAMDVSIAPKDQVARLVFTDGDKIWLYRIVERALEPEWTFTGGGLTMSPGKIISVQLADLDGDGEFEVVANRYHPDPAILLTSFILGTRAGKPEALVKNLNDILWAVDASGDGVKKALWAQVFSKESFFRKGQATRYVLKGNGLSPDGNVRVPATFRATGLTLSNITGKGTRGLVFVDEYQRLRVSIESEETWRSSTPVGGGSHLKLELLKGGTSSRTSRSEFFNFEPVPLSVDLDGDGVDEVIVPQNQLDGHLAVVFRGPAGYRFQSINTGFEGTITALGAIPGENPPSLIAAVVRFTNFLKSSGETQIIMTTGE